MRLGFLPDCSSCFRVALASISLPLSKGEAGAYLKYIAEGNFLCIKWEISLPFTPISLSLLPRYMMFLFLSAISYIPRVFGSLSTFSLVNFVHCFCIGIKHLQINLARLGVALALRLKDAFVKSCSAYRRYCHNLPQVLCFPMCLSLPCHANRSCTVTTNTRRSTVVTISPRRNCISFGMRYSLGSKPLPSTASLACGKLGITKHLSKLRLLTSTMLTPKLITFN